MIQNRQLWTSHARVESNFDTIKTPVVLNFGYIFDTTNRIPIVGCNFDNINLILIVGCNFDTTYPLSV